MGENDLDHCTTCTDDYRIADSTPGQKNSPAANPYVVANNDGRRLRFADGEGAILLPLAVSRTDSGVGGMKRGIDLHVGAIIALWLIIISL